MTGKRIGDKRLTPLLHVSNALESLYRGGNSDPRLCEWAAERGVVKRGAGAKLRATEVAQTIWLCIQRIFLILMVQVFEMFRFLMARLGIHHEVRKDGAVHCFQFGAHVRTTYEPGHGLNGQTRHYYRGELVTVEYDEKHALHGCIDHFGDARRFFGTASTEDILHCRWYREGDEYDRHGCIDFFGYNKRWLWREYATGHPRHGCKDFYEAGRKVRTEYSADHPFYYLGERLRRRRQGARLSVRNGRRADDAAAPDRDR